MSTKYKPEQKHLRHENINSHCEEGVADSFSDYFDNSK